MNRSTRTLDLAEIGATYYGRCAHIVDEAKETELAVGRLRSEPRGVLKVTASVAFGTLHTAPAIPEFFAR
jgi:DNA-binding transcriptional LysR family regulator